MKETVIIESYDEKESYKVCITPYDLDEKTSVGGVIEILPRDEAYENYEVVGEITNGDLRLFDDEDEPNDFLDDFGIEEDDD